MLKDCRIAEGPLENRQRLVKPKQDENLTPEIGKDKFDIEHITILMKDFKIKWRMEVLQFCLYFNITKHSTLFLRMRT